MVSIAVPIKRCDQGAEATGHESRWANRARVTPAGALAWVAYVRVVISACAFTIWVIPDGQGIAMSQVMGSRDPRSRQSIF